MKDILMSKKLNNLLYYAKNCFAGYPYSVSQDPGYFELLLDEFTELDLLEELKLYYAWTLDTKNRSSLLYRTLFRLWLLQSRSSRTQLLDKFIEKDRI